MMKKLLSLILLGCTVLSVANADMTQATPEQESALEASRQSYLNSQGITLPDHNVQVVPRNSISLPAELKKQVMADKRAMLKQGYVEKSNPRLLELRDIDHTAVYEKKKYQNNTNPMSTPGSRGFRTVIILAGFNEWIKLSSHISDCVRV